MVVVDDVVHAPYDDGLGVPHEAHGLGVQLDDDPGQLAVLYRVQAAVAARDGEPVLHVQDPRPRDEHRDAGERLLHQHGGARGVQDVHVPALRAQHHAAHGVPLDRALVQHREAGDHRLLRQRRAPHTLHKRGAVPGLVHLQQVQRPRREVHAHVPQLRELLARRLRLHAPAAQRVPQRGLGRVEIYIRQRELVVGPEVAVYEEVLRGGHGERGDAGLLVVRVEGAHGDGGVHERVLACQAGALPHLELAVGVRDEEAPVAVAGEVGGVHALAERRDAGDGVKPRVQPHRRRALRARALLHLPGKVGQCRPRHGKGGPLGRGLLVVGHLRPGGGRRGRRRRRRRRERRRGLRGCHGWPLT
mmetsp:Transcript_11120/g.38625  ORF Transcript_11120/g.38625 Transcript_11120/m.38625 type:complete len:360 (-) Transcript_11120:133-1212(-)